VVKTTPISGRDLELVEEALTRIVRRARQRPAHDQLMAAAGLSMERAAFSVARLCEDGPVRLSDLAARLDVNVSTISRHVQQLERDGLLRRGDDPRDRRAAMLHLTPEGRSVLKRAWGAKRAALIRIFDGWEPHERHTFAELLSRFSHELEGALLPVARERPGRRHPGDARSTGPPAP
jgi:DNA-binding MarR family transcriptional regulator